MSNRSLRQLLVSLLVLVPAGPGTAAPDTEPSRVPPRCQQNRDCGLWAYWESEGPDDTRPRTTDTAGVGRVLERDTWEYTDTIHYGKGAQQVGRIFVLVNLSVDDRDRHRVFFLMRSEVETGPPVRMTHRYECREDDVRDHTCEGGPGTEESTSAGFQDDFQSDDFVQHPRDKRDKVFWNFDFRWMAAGIDDCCFFIPRQTSKRYECAGAEGCFFDARSNG